MVDNLKAQKYVKSKPQIIEMKPKLSVDNPNAQLHGKIQIIKMKPKPIADNLKAKPCIQIQIQILMMKRRFHFFYFFLRSSSIFFVGILSSWVKIRLHTENQLPMLPGSALKVPGGCRTGAGARFCQLIIMSHSNSS